MNNKGIGYFYTLMLGVVIIIMSLALAPVAKQFKDSAMNETMEGNFNGTLGLNCTDPNIDRYNEANCYAVDVMYYLVAGGGVLIGIAIIGVKLWAG